MSAVQMDAATRAMCYAYRNPGPGQKPLKLKHIRKLVKCKDGKTRPTLSGISQAASSFKEEKQKRGRKTGWRATTKAEDKQILRTFHKLRPPGHGVDSNVLTNGLSQKIKKKVGRKTIIRRLAEKGSRASQMELFIFPQHLLPRSCT